MKKPILYNAKVLHSSPSIDTGQIERYVQAMIDFKLWDRFEKPKEKKINNKHKVLIMHYSGMLDAVKSKKDKTSLVSLICGCNPQTAKEYVLYLDDFKEMKTVENLTIVLDFFTDHNLKPAIDLVNKDFERLRKRLTINSK